MYNGKFQDIQSAMQSFKVSEEHFRAVVQTAKDAIISINGEGLVTFWNQAATEIFGFTAEEMLGHSLLRIVPTQFRQQHGVGLQKVLNTGISGLLGSTFELYGLRKDGTEIPLEISLSRWLNNGDTYFTGILRDISERRQAEEELRQRLRLNNLISKLSAKFINLPFTEIDGAIQQVLEEIGYFVGADRAYIYFYQKRSDTISHTHEWCAAGIAPQAEQFQELPLNVMPWFAQKLRSLQVAIIPAVSELPEEASVERKYFAEQDILSLVAVPIVLESRLMGFLGFDSVKTVKQWTQDDILLLKITGEIFAGALSRLQSEKKAAASHERLKTVMDSITSPVQVIDLETYEILFVNKAGRKEWGDVRGTICWQTLQAGQTGPCGFCTNDKLVLEDGTPAEEQVWEYQNTKNGRWYECRDRAISWLDGRLVRFHIATDITERRGAQKELMESEQRLADIINFLPDATYVINLEGQVIAWNQAIEEMTGLMAKQVMGKDYQIYSLPFYDAAQPMLINLALHPGQASADQFESVQKIDDRGYMGELFAPKLGEEGKHVWVKATRLYNTCGEVEGAIESIRDISDKKQVEEQLRYMGLHDQLTGLYNRSYFEDTMRRLNKSREYPVTLISADLDGLKLINDMLGHAGGDLMLKNCAELLQASLRKSDVLARIGGDEFVIILPNADEAVGEAIIKRIQSDMEEYNRENAPLPIHVSLGQATTAATGESLEEVLKRADAAMYREKLHRSSSTRGKVVSSLLQALTERDYHEGHVARLQDYCRHMGQKIGLHPSRLTDLLLLAQVHDLGKVGIPETILYKKASLTAEEFEVIKTHTEKGFRIARSSPDLTGIADLILKHHEHWDGSGYPLGIKGEEIPLECRILAVVDAFDVMTQKRPYGRVKNTKEAITELKRCAGTQFDPVVVNLFVELLAESA